MNGQCNISTSKPIRRHHTTRGGLMLHNALHNIVQYYSHCSYRSIVPLCRHSQKTHNRHWTHTHTDRHRRTTRDTHRQSRQARDTHSQSRQAGDTHRQSRQAGDTERQTNQKGTHRDTPDTQRWISSLTLNIYKNSKYRIPHNFCLIRRLCQSNGARQEFDISRIQNDD